MMLPDEPTRVARLAVVQAMLEKLWEEIQEKEFLCTLKVAQHVAKLRTRQAVLEKEEERLLKQGRRYAKEIM